MKPLGTITMHFPYVDDKTRAVLQLIMNEAENFGDFTEKLCDRVCKEVSPPLLEFFAVFFAYHIEYYSLIDKLESAGKVSDLSRPLFLLINYRSLSPSVEDIGWTESRESLIRALSAAPNDWIASLVYVAWRMLAESRYPECDVDIHSLDVIASSADEKSDFSYFKTFLHVFKARRYLREYKREDAIGEYKQALAVSRKIDDQVLTALIMNYIAGRIKQTDLKQAIDLFISSRELCEQLGHKVGVGLVQHQLGHILGFRGEMDAAIEYHFEYRAIREASGIRHETMNPVIAFFYNQFGNGQQAYSLAKTVHNLIGSKSRQLAYGYAQLAWALINLDRCEDAKTELATAHEFAMKSGDSIQLLWVRLVEAVLEKEEQNYDIATMIFREVSNIVEETPAPVIQNVCLINLTEIEIDTLTEESLNENLDSSGSWMKKLTEHAEKKDLPGVAARAMLLKAKLRQRQKQYDEVRKLLKEVHETAQAPSMKYLNDLAISMFPDIIIT